MAVVTHQSALHRLRALSLVPPARPWRPVVREVDPDLPQFQPVPVVMGSRRVYPECASRPLEKDGAAGTKTITVLKDLGRGPLQVSNLRMGNEVLPGCIGRLVRAQKTTPSHDDPAWGTFSYELLEGRAGETGLYMVPQDIGTQGLNEILPRSGGKEYGDLVTENTEAATTEIGIAVVFPTGFSKKSVVRGKTVWSDYTGKIRVWSKAASAAASTYSVRHEEPVTGRGGDASFQVTIPHVLLGTTSQKWTIGVQLQGMAPGANPRATWTSLTSRGPKTLGNLAGHALLAVQFGSTAFGGDRFLHALNVDAAAELKETVGGAVVTATGGTRNPSAAFIDILQGAGNPDPLPDARLDSTSIAAWKTANETASLHFDFVFGADGGAGTIREALDLVAAAGRARAVVRDGKYGVILEPSGDPVELYTPANILPGSFRVIREAYGGGIHGIRCTVENRANAFARETFIVYQSGYTEANASIFEDWEFPGNTVRQEATDLAAYHLRVLAARSLQYEFGTDIEHLRATRGDLVRVAHYRTRKGTSWGRVTEIPVATTLRVSRVCEMATGGSYGIRFRAAGGAQTTSTVTTTAGRHLELTTTAAHGATVGDLYAFGVLNDESLLCVVLKVAHGADRTAVLTVAPAGSGVGTGTGSNAGARASDPAPLKVPTLTSVGNAGGLNFKFGSGK